MKITGERVSAPVGGFNPAFRKHAAAYRFAASMLSDGPVLDLGCGVGHGMEWLSPRSVVGLDVSVEAVGNHKGRAACGDMRALPFSSDTFSSLVSIQSIEHVPDPDRALAETIRVLRTDGVAVFVTPNRLTFGRPDEIIDPFHFIEYSADQLRALCSPHFSSVEILGLFGSDRYMSIHDTERRKLARLLAVDPLKVRRLVPRRGKQFLYDWILNRGRLKEDPVAASITIDDFELSTDHLDESLDLVALCRGPR